MFFWNLSHHLQSVTNYLILYIGKIFQILVPLMLQGHVIDLVPNWLATTNCYSCIHLGFLLTLTVHYVLDGIHIAPKSRGTATDYLSRTNHLSNHIDYNKCCTKTPIIQLRFNDRINDVMSMKPTKFYSEIKLSSDLRIQVLRSKVQANRQTGSVIVDTQSCLSIFSFRSSYLTYIERVYWHLKRSL